MFNRGWKHLDTRFGGAVCIPAACSADFVPSLMKQIFNGSGLVLATDYDQNDYCQSRDVKEYKAIDHVAKSEIDNLFDQDFQNFHIFAELLSSR